MGKALCVVLVFWNVEIVKKSLNFLAEQADELDIFVVENRSEATNSEIKPFVLDLLARDKIAGYFLFERNITVNALEVVFDSGLLDLGAYDYLLLTEGDLIVPDEGWLAEERRILDNNPEVFVCGIGLSEVNLPRHLSPDAHKWLSPPMRETEDYYEVEMGIYLLLFRMTDFQSFLRYRRKTNKRFREVVLRSYCREELGRVWARPKQFTAVHLTWDIYHDPAHPYSKLRLSTPAKELWWHYRYSPFRFFTKQRAERHIPWGKLYLGFLRSDAINSTRLALSKLRRAIPVRLL
jgi:hypothetical protein